MADTNPQDKNNQPERQGEPQNQGEKQQSQGSPVSGSEMYGAVPSSPMGTQPDMYNNPQSSSQSSGGSQEGRPIERQGGHDRGGLRGTAAMDPDTRKEVARKGGLAVSRNKQHMADIGRKGGQSVSKNREHMAKIGRKGGAASRGHR